MQKSRHFSPAPHRARPPLAAPGLRIGVMGGSFNPPHAGHVRAARTALGRLQLDAVWWVVTPGNPLKAQGGRVSLDERMAACRALVRDPRIVITGFEAELGTSYTAATLAYLKRRFPATRLVWVMGADNLATFHQWHRWRSIARLVPICVVDRPLWRLKALASPAARALWRSRVPEARAARLADMRPPAWCFLTARLSPASSTELRGEVTEKPHISGRAR